MKNITDMIREKMAEIASYMVLDCADSDEMHEFVDITIDAFDVCSKLQALADKYLNKKED